MRVSVDLVSSCIAGAATGLFGVFAFGIIHASLIVPIWNRLFGGIPFALVAGVAMSWAFHELRSAGKFGLKLRDGLAFGFLLWLSLIPMTGFAALLRAWNLRSTLGDWEIVGEVILALTTGAVAGWWWTRSLRATAALGAATLALTLVMGGPVAVMNSARAMYLFVSFLGIYPVSGMLFVLLLSVLLRRLHPMA